MKTLKRVGTSVYIFFYIISSQLAISAYKGEDVLLNLENALNKKNLEIIYSYFEEDEKLKIKNKLEKMIKEFPNAIWEIKKVNSIELNKNMVNVSISGSNVIDNKEFHLESNFDYLYNLKKGKIVEGFITNDLTTIRSDRNKIDITIDIPDRVLTGSKYDIDIIINEPLGEEIYAGGINSYQEEFIFKQEIKLEPLVTGGIFKVTRAPNRKGTQTWTGIITHSKGIVTFTKTVHIVEKI